MYLLTLKEGFVVNEFGTYANAEAEARRIARRIAEPVHIFNARRGQEIATVQAGGSAIVEKSAGSGIPTLRS